MKAPDNRTDEKEDDKTEQVPLFKSWTAWYVVVILFLVLLIFFFHLFTNYFS